MESTVVSLLPFSLREYKAGLYPMSTFDVPKSPDNGVTPGVLVIPDGFTRYMVDDGTGKARFIDAIVLGEELARSVVEDYTSSSLEIGPDFRPGLFWVRGGFSADGIVKQFKKELESARATQRNWFIQLVRLADDDWGKYRQHKFITDIQRYAVRYLHMDKEWDRAIEQQELINCVACKSPIPSAALICAICRTIVKPEEYAKLGYKQAGVA